MHTHTHAHAVTHTHTHTYTHTHTHTHIHTHTHTQTQMPARIGCEESRRGVCVIFYRRWNQKRMQVCMAIVTKLRVNANMKNPSLHGNSDYSDSIVTIAMHSKLRVISHKDKACGAYPRSSGGHMKLQARGAYGCTFTCTFKSIGIWMKIQVERHIDEASYR